MSGIYENVLATAEEFRRFSQDFRRLLKMSEDIPMTFEHLWFERIVDIWKLLRLL